MAARRARCPARRVRAVRPLRRATWRRRRPAPRLRPAARRVRRTAPRAGRLRRPLARRDIQALRSCRARSRDSTSASRSLSAAASFFRAASRSARASAASVPARSRAAAAASRSGAKLLELIARTRLRRGDLVARSRQLALELPCGLLRRARPLAQLARRLRVGLTHPRQLLVPPRQLRPRGRELVLEDGGARSPRRAPLGGRGGSLGTGIVLGDRPGAGAAPPGRGSR